MKTKKVIVVIGAGSIGQAIAIGFVTKDVEAAFNTAVRAGATSVSKPKTKPWGQVVSYVRDCNGFLVEICSPMGSSN